jgi:hypothetical protein
MLRVPPNCLGMASLSYKAAVGVVFASVKAYWIRRQPFKSFCMSRPTKPVAEGLRSFSRQTFFIATQGAHHGVS